MMVFTKLYFNKIAISYVPPTISVAPNFLCPVCNGRPQNLLSKTWNCALNRALDVNQKVSFTLSCCGNTVELFLGVHKEAGSPYISVCLMKSSEEGAGGLPADWWDF